MIQELVGILEECSFNPRSRERTIQRRTSTGKRKLVSIRAPVRERYHSIDCDPQA